MAILFHKHKSTTTKLTIKGKSKTYFRTFLDKRYNRSAARANNGIFIIIEASKITAGGELLMDDDV